MSEMLACVTVETSHPSLIKLLTLRARVYAFRGFMVLLLRSGEQKSRLDQTLKRSAVKSERWKYSWRFPVLLCSLSVRVHVAGLNKGGMETFIDNLPGFPDNIRPSSSGGYWVAMSAVRPNPGFSMLDFLSQRPWIKKLIFKVRGFGRVRA